MRCYRERGLAMTSSQTGRRLDDFLKLEKLGEGTYGVVFKVLIAASYRVSHDTGHLENLAKSQVLYSAPLDIRIASFLSHANVFCQTYSHSIHFGAETSHSLSTLQQYILVSL